MILLSVQARGALYAAILFLLCAAAVHAIRLAAIGYRSLRKKKPSKRSVPKPPPPEPVYFLVERKKKRPKPEYSEPKRIQFK